ncbi:MAG: hypothetical protein JNK82_16500 [Myxococcaceae bacterium]|nr:hypothetical protein [Myxococcaceae bacterium]
MKRFDPSDEARDRLQAFTKALGDALVPDSGEAESLQGERVRTNERLRSRAGWPQERARGLRAAASPGEVLALHRSRLRSAG